MLQELKIVTQFFFSRTFCLAFLKNKISSTILEFAFIFVKEILAFRITLLSVRREKKYSNHKQLAIIYVENSSFS